MRVDRCALFGSLALALGSTLVIACLAVGEPKPRDARTLPRAPAAVREAPDPSRLERDTVDAINRERVRAGLTRLAVSPELTRIAREHSAYQARTGRFGHVGAGGSRLSDRARKQGIDYRVIAENVAMNLGYSDPVGNAVSGWMDSPGHRKNILNPVFEQTGVGIETAPDGKIYFTQLFRDPP